MHKNNVRFLYLTLDLILR